MSDYRIYVACLASYNNGILHGVWIDLDEDSDVDYIHAEVKRMLDASPANLDHVMGYACKAEEYAIHDFELEGVKIGEYESFETIVKIVAGLCEHGEAFAVYCNYHDFQYIDDFEGAYVGTYSEKEDWAEEHWEESGLLESIPKNLHYYIDYAAYARDAESEGMTFLKGSEGYHAFQD